VFYVNFRLLKTIYVHLSVCYLNKFSKTFVAKKSVTPGVARIIGSGMWVHGLH